VVNNVVVTRTTVVNVTQINVYRNVGVRHAVVAVRPDRFGRGSVGEARIRDVDNLRLEPVRGAVDLRPDRASFTPAGGRGIRPPENVLERGVVATRAPVTRALPREPEGRGPAPQIVPAPRPGETGARPPLGQSRIERQRPPRAPRFDNDRRPDATPPLERRTVEPGRRQETPAAQEPRRAPDQPRGTEAQRPPVQRAPDAPRAPEPRRVPEPQRAPQPQRAPEIQRPETPRGQDAPAGRRGAADASRPARREGGDPGSQPRAAERPAVQAPRPEAPRPQPRVLPGEPANRLYPGPGRVERPAPRGPEAKPAERPRPAPEQGGGRERKPAGEGR
jgi:translation initiation factor IF-2